MVEAEKKGDDTGSGRWDRFLPALDAGKYRDPNSCVGGEGVCVCVCEPHYIPESVFRRRRPGGTRLRRGAPTVCVCVCVCVCVGPRQEIVSSGPAGVQRACSRPVPRFVRDLPRQLRIHTAHSSRRQVLASVRARCLGARRWQLFRTGGAKFSSWLWRLVGVKRRKTLLEEYLSRLNSL